MISQELSSIICVEHVVNDPALYNTFINGMKRGKDPASFIFYHGLIAIGQVDRLKELIKLHAKKEYL